MSESTDEEMLNKLLRDAGLEPGKNWEDIYSWSSVYLNRKIKNDNKNYKIKNVKYDLPNKNR